MIPLSRLFLSVSAFVFAVGALQAEPLRFESAGTRFGIGGNSSSSDFHEVSGFTRFDIPTTWAVGRCVISPRLDFSAGWLREKTTDAAIFSAGPVFAIGTRELPIVLETGISPTGLSRSDFPGKDLGLCFQFTTYAGVGLDLPWRLRVAYRYSHMSNAHMSSHNSGLNLHGISVSFRF